MASVDQSKAHDMGLHNLAAHAAIESRQYAYAYRFFLGAYRASPDYDRSQFPALARTEAIVQ